jgi:hypothetical protein
MKSLSAAERLFSSRTIASYADAVLYIFRSGKSWEVFYFLLLEVRYWACRLLRVRSKLIDFGVTPYWRCRSDEPLKIDALLSTLHSCGVAGIETPTNWGLITATNDGLIIGTIRDEPHVLKRSNDLFDPPVNLFEFSSPILMVFVSRSDYIFVSTKGLVYVSKNGGRHFEVVLELSNVESAVWSNHGIDETPEGLIIGEYGIIVERSRSRSFWRSVAFLYVTRDFGDTWDRIDYLSQTGGKHVHLVKYSRRFRRLLVTDGDKRKRSFWLNGIRRMGADDFRRGRFDSLLTSGGHTAFTEVTGATILGTDNHGGTNSIISINSNSAISVRMLPPPYRHSPVINMHSVYAVEQSATFVSLFSGIREKWKSALIYSDDAGKTWKRLIEYNGQKVAFSIANSQEGQGLPLILAYENLRSGEKKTFIILPGLNFGNRDQLLRS